MKRRSFLELLAVLPGLGWLASPSEALAGEREPPLLTLQEIFDDIQKFVAEHPGATVISADNPGQLRLGWVAFKTYENTGLNRVSSIEGPYEISKHWEISISRLKRETVSRAHPLCTTFGRREIAERLQAGLTVEW